VIGSRPGLVMTEIVPCIAVFAVVCAQFPTAVR
jgi:hypothetical protein